MVELLYKYNPVKVEHVGISSRPRYAVVIILHFNV